jgi:hypothetical protein
MGWDGWKRIFWWGAGIWLFGTIILRIARINSRSYSTILLIDDLNTPLRSSEHFGARARNCSLRPVGLAENDMEADCEWKSASGQRASHFSRNSTLRHSADEVGGAG